MRNLFTVDGKCTSYYAILGDWSFDLFFETCQTTKALPIKGVHPSRNASEAEAFVAWLKADFRDWLERMYEEYDCSRESLEDMFKMYARESFFSDCYKDAFNQRPHLKPAFYLFAMGYENVGGLRFCMSPFSDDVADAVWSAKAFRDWLEAKAKEEAGI